MTVHTGPVSESRFTIGEMEALSKIKATPYLDEADLFYPEWRLPLALTPALRALTPAERAWYEKAWRTAFGLE